MSNVSDLKASFMSPQRKKEQTKKKKFNLFADSINLIYSRKRIKNQIKSKTETKNKNKTKTSLIDEYFKINEKVESR